MLSWESPQLFIDEEGNGGKQMFPLVDQKIWVRMYEINRELDVVYYTVGACDY